MPDISAPSKKLPDQPAEDGAKLDMRTLAESLHLSNAYRTQYMDDNPLVGEPGSFIMHKSKDAPVPLPASKVALKTYAPTTAVSTPIPPPLKTDIPPISARKGSKIGDKTPTTPGGKKRKKSRVATMTTSPK
jgi:mediator of RNA polymerase II transcription subunit 6